MWEGETVILGVFNEVWTEQERFRSMFNIQGAMASLIELPLGGTDNANILRERSKPDKHGHGKGIECARAGRMLSKGHVGSSFNIKHSAPHWSNHKENASGCKEHTKMQDFTLNPSLKKHNGSDTRNATIGNPCAHQSDSNGS
ncbi:hypothetical protein Tco_0494451 [Tanacetum coccineum]